MAPERLEVMVVSYLVTTSGSPGSPLGSGMPSDSGCRDPISEALWPLFDPLTGDSSIWIFSRLRCFVAGPSQWFFFVKSLPINQHFEHCSSFLMRYLGVLRQLQGFSQDQCDASRDAQKAHAKHPCDGSTLPRSPLAWNTSRLNCGSN